jgi:electron transfer flavoprotein beta subunit
MNNIVICIKHIHNIGLSDFDIYALEEGIKLKRQNKYNSKIKVIVFTMGPSQAEKTLRAAIAQGADEAYLLIDSKYFKGSDTIATSYILSTAIKLFASKYNIIICGKKTFDSGTGQVGPAIATMLNIPNISYVREIKYCEQNIISVERIIDNKHEILTSPLPVLITVIKGEYKPRIASIKSKLFAQKAIIKSFNAIDLNIDTSKIGIQGSPTQIISLNDTIKCKRKFTGSASYVVSNFIEQCNK